MDETAARTPSTPDQLHDLWPVLSTEDRIQAFKRLSADDADSFFHSLSRHSQADIIRLLAPVEGRFWLRQLPPDDIADVLQEVSSEDRARLLDQLEAATRQEVTGLLAYAEDQAGGLMNPRFARVRPDITINEAIQYVRRQTQKQLELIYYVYVLDSQQALLGVVSFRELFTADGNRLVRDVMNRDVVSIREETDQETVARLIARQNVLALPVVDAQGRMKGIVTVDDVIDVVDSEATEDIHKFGGLEAIETPYLRTPFLTMVEKRAGWLSILFIGEMLTATAMGYFEVEIARAVVLALFVPLIISSGGNSGSQASTLVIRAMALGQVRLRDWWRIVYRELASGLTLGAILATIGLVRILVWQMLFHTYGEHYVLVAATVSLSLVGVVCWGTLSGAMLPFILSGFGFDPASASAPFVATLVDVSGLIIYFSVAALILGGTLL